MNALSMAIGGGFFGTAVALTMGFFVVRYHVRSAIEQWLEKAHRAGICPVCKGPMKHDEVGAPPENAPG